MDVLNHTLIFSFPTAIFHNYGKNNVIWTTISCDNLLDNQILQRSLGSDTKIKAIERESRLIMWVWEIKLSKNCCSNIISLMGIDSFMIRCYWTNFRWCGATFLVTWKIRYFIFLVIVWCVRTMINVIIFNGDVSDFHKIFGLIYNMFTPARTFNTV